MNLDGMEAPLWRALAVFRVLSLVYATVLYALVFTDYDRPVGGWLVLAGMAGWTVFIGKALRRPPARRWPLLGLDLAVAWLAVVVPSFLDDPARIEAGAQTLPGTWAAAPVLAWAIIGGPGGGAAAALVIAVADVVHRGGLSESTAHSIVLLLLVGTIVGYVIALARVSELRLARALQVESATRERERLARGIHDGVLQVLALVARRGAEAGGPAAELGRLAGDQEAALRALVTSGDTAGADGSVDLRSLLTTYASARVDVAAPASPVLLPAVAARELAAAVGAALDNVTRHAGQSARAWVLVEDTPEDVVVVSVRDDGAGIRAGRLAEAADEGRLGVAASIRGRMVALGGSVTIESGPAGAAGQQQWRAGTEVELRLPRTAVAARRGSVG
jgi:signal transduction histidine kinase